MLQEKKSVLSVVVPVFNEELMVDEAVRRLKSLRQNLYAELNVEIIFVDDGSSDGTFDKLVEIAQECHFIKIISLSRNFGHQIAITAGIDLAVGDYVVVIDADLQDPPELIEDMYRLALTGVDVVYGKRKHRAGETGFKKVTAAVFYRLLSYMCEIDIPKDTGDFRLMSRRVVDAFKQLREQHRFVRGMVPWLGFKTVPLEYDRAERYAGTTKYPLRRMIAFAANAIFSFSKKPLTLAINVGFFTIIFGMLLAGYMFYLKIFTSAPVPGVSAVLISIVFFSGVQIFLIGIVGEYIARIFEEAKGRPLYIISEKINM